MGTRRRWQLEAQGSPRGGDRIPRSGILGTDLPLLWLFPSPSADSWQGILNLGFFCVERIPWDTLEAEVKDVLETFWSIFCGD